MTRHSLWLPVAAALALGFGTAPATHAADTDRVLAVFDGKTITEADVRASNRAFFNAFERRKRQWFHAQLEADLQTMINFKLVDAEVAARGVTHKEVLDSIAFNPVSDTDIAAYYEKYKDAYQVPLETAAPRIKSLLESRRQDRAWEVFLKGLRSKYKVEEKLEPLRDTVDANGPYDGPEKAPIAIVEFSDFECELCGTLTSYLQALKARYPETVKIVYRHLPRASSPNAMKAAEASLCAADQDAFWDMHDVMFGNQSALTLDDLKKSAAALKLNSKKFNACLDSGKKKGEIQKELEQATALGLTDAPAMFINGRFLSVTEAVPEKEITAVIDDELRRLAAGSIAGTQTPDPKRVLAMVIGQPITEGEVLAANTTNYKAGALAIARDLHDELEGHLDRMINNRLVDAAAAARGISREAILSEMKPAVTGADVDSFYKANEKQIALPKEQAAERIRSYLEQQATHNAQLAYLSTLKSRHKIEVKLEPFRDVVAATGPAVGPPDAPVTLIEFSDFECRYCGQNFEILEAIRARYGNKLRIVFRQFPLSIHPDAQKAAEASLCALEQGKFWELHDVMFKNQHVLGVEDLKKSAAALGIDSGKFATCLDSGRTAATVQRDREEGLALGIEGTPAMFVNGRFLNGSVPLDQLTEVIDDELRRHGN